MGIKGLFLAREWVISYVKNPLRVERDNIVAGDPKDFLSPGYIHALDTLLSRRG